MYVHVLYMYNVLYTYIHVCRFCSQREVEISRLENPVLSQFMPVIYHTIMDTSKVYIHTPTACILVPYTMYVQV